MITLRSVTPKVTIHWGEAMLTLLKRWLDAPLWADHSSSSHPSQISRNKTKLGLGVAFAVGTLCASLQSAAAAPGPLVTTKEGIVQGIHLQRRRRVSWRSLRRAAARQSALEAAEEPCAMGGRPEDAGLCTNLRADHDARRFRGPGEQQRRLPLSQRLHAESQSVSASFRSSSGSTAAATSTARPPATTAAKWRQTAKPSSSRWNTV